MKNRALISLLLLVPAPSVGVLFGMILYPDAALGNAVFILSKIWILLLPAVWFFLIEKSRIAFGKTAAGGFRSGFLTGVAISVFIVGAVLICARWIDQEFLRNMMVRVGLDHKVVYLGATAYWVLVNSVLEEYVWRWFVVRQCVKLTKPAAAMVVSALGFTLHHVLAMQVYFSWPVTLGCAAGIMVGGLLWSWMFLRYKTIWPGWLSHALVDVAVFGAGYWLIFG